MAWQEIHKNETTNIGHALALLQATAPYYNLLSVAILNGKLQPGTKPSTQFHCLRLYSFGVPSAPLVSAFFFLRRRKKKGNADAPGLWAYCLTVGAKDTAQGGLTSDDLRDALNDICVTMKSLFPAVKREIMHLPPAPVLNPQNLKDVYAELHSNAQPPKKKPRFESQGTIQLGYPWVPLDANHNEVFKTFVWLEIIER